MVKRRNTASKQDVLATLESTEAALSHDMIQAALPKMDRVTIYRVLNQFCEDGIAHRIVGDDGKQYFARCTNCQVHDHQHNHFHFRCLTCGTVKCLDREVTVSLPRGYALENFNGLLSGRCNQCS